MQRLIVLSVCIIMSCLASQVVQRVEVGKQEAASELATTALAFDLDYPVSVPIFNCFAQMQYKVVFIRAYKGLNQGQIDSGAVGNIRNAVAAGLGTEVYMTPQPGSYKSGTRQFDEMYNMLSGEKLDVKSVWVQVVTPAKWFGSFSSNINFINSILGRAMQYGLTVGVYSSEHEWKEITDNATTRNVRLWYWKTNGNGDSGETAPNFDDFKGFGSWTSPSVKQFGQSETVCGVVVNRDVYRTSSDAPSGLVRHEKPDQIVVGRLGLQGGAITGKPEIIPK